MDFEAIVTQRQSCRSYDAARPVEEEKLRRCVAAARLAPSACNSQPWHFTVATGGAARKVGDCTRGMGMNAFTADCPAFVVISEAPYNASAAVGAKVKKQDYRSVDIGIAAAYLTACATELGLGCCIVGWFDEKKLQQLLKTEARVRLVVALGYAKADDPQRKKSRKPEGETATWLSD